LTACVRYPENGCVVSVMGIWCFDLEVVL
jgi:hypothetical protein